MTDKMKQEADSTHTVMHNEIFKEEDGGGQVMVTADKQWMLRWD